MRENVKLWEILLRDGLVTRDVIEKSLDYQERYEVGISQYLIAYGHVNEKDISETIVEYSGCPYLPVYEYKIPQSVLDLIPVDIASKYWLIPIDKCDDMITVVMFDPSDSEAIAAVEDVTGLKVEPFVGVLSDIISAIEQHHNVTIEDKRLKKHDAPPLFVKAGDYCGFERRRSVRVKPNLSVGLLTQAVNLKYSLLNISNNGLLFESERPVSAGSYLTLQIDLPDDAGGIPMAVVVQIVRVIKVSDLKYIIAASIVKMCKEDRDLLARYLL